MVQYRELIWNRYTRSYQFGDSTNDACGIKVAFRIIVFAHNEDAGMAPSCKD
jgi:hypothetical protein